MTTTMMEHNIEYHLRCQNKKCHYTQVAKTRTKICFYYLEHYELFGHNDIEIVWIMDNRAKILTELEIWDYINFMYVLYSKKREKVKIDR